MRRFVLQRDHDATGVSGVGTVAEGVQFRSGRVAMQWLGSTPSIVFHESMENLERIHGHNGSSRVEWLD